MLPAKGRGQSLLFRAKARLQFRFLDCSVQIAPSAFWLALGLRHFLVNFFFFRIAYQLLYYKVVQLTTKQIDYTGTKFLTATAPGALASV